MSESFEETKKLLEKDIKRLKIKITKANDIKFEKEEDEKDRLAENDQLTQISKRLAFKLVRLVEDLHYYFLEEIPKEIKEPLRILNYYMLFFSVKIHRAILSNIEEREMKYEDTTFDSKNSAFLSYVSIVKIINALINISNYKNLDHNLNKKVF